MALIPPGDLEGAGLTLPQACEALITLEIERTTWAIKDALWSVPADIERAKVLISKRMGLRICADARLVKLKPLASDALAAG